MRCSQLTGSIRSALKPQVETASAIPRGSAVGLVSINSQLTRSAERQLPDVGKRKYRSLRGAINVINRA